MLRMRLGVGRRAGWRLRWGIRLALGGRSLAAGIICGRRLTLALVGSRCDPGCIYVHLVDMPRRWGGINYRMRRYGCRI